MRRPYHPTRTRQTNHRDHAHHGTHLADPAYEAWADLYRTHLAKQGRTRRRRRLTTTAAIIFTPWALGMTALAVYGHASPQAAGVVLTLIAALSVLGAFLAYAAKGN